MKTRNRLLTTWFFLAALAWAPAAEAVPSKMSYTGYVEYKGKAENGASVKVEFKIYSEAVVGKLVWWDYLKVEKVIPEVVHTDREGYKSVDYTKLVPVLVEAVKEQDGVIKRQQKQYHSLQREVRQLKVLVAQLARKR